MNVQKKEKVENSL